MNFRALVSILLITTAHAQQASSAPEKTKADSANPVNTQPAPSPEPVKIILRDGKDAAVKPVPQKMQVEKVRRTAAPDMVGPSPRGVRQYKSSDDARMEQQELQRQLQKQRLLTEGPDWSPYLADLKRRMDRAWFPPTKSKKNQLYATTVVFTNNHDGQITNLHVSQSSGNLIFDKAALTAVENSSPYRPLPEGAPASVDMEFKFSYEKVSASRIEKPKREKDYLP